jgi:ADP-ribosylglycohydrolase
MIDFETRARNALFGLALGDAIGWPAMYHRARTLPAWTRRIRRDIDAQREEANVLRIPMPFSLNQPSEAFELYPTDDTEWAAWMMENLIQHGCVVEQAWVYQRWNILAHSAESVRGGISTHAALENLRRGLTPPATGRDNPHYFDDGAICRAVPIGIASAGNPGRASEAAAIDASVTNFADGVWVACAAASAVAEACAGGTIESVIAAAVEALPGESWSRRAVDDALHIARNEKSDLGLIPALHGILNREYSDGCVGPESLALSLALVSCLSMRFGEAILTAAAFARTADTVPALVGAIVGAMSPGDVVPAAWKNLATLRGICLRELAGRDYLRLVDQFVECASASMKRSPR